MKRTKLFSLRLPLGIYIHYAGGRLVGLSRPSYGRGLIHYNSRKRLAVKTIRNTFGEPNHYTPQGKCIGYSRRSSWSKVLHYSINGHKTGYTYHIFSLICFTCFTALPRTEFIASPSSHHCEQFRNKTPLPQEKHFT